MKKIIAFVILLTIAKMNCFSQQSDSLKSISKTDYLRKGKIQKTAAWVLLGGGIAMAVIGVSEFEPLLATAGVLAAAGSIPFFIASGKNKKKARSMSTGFKMENAPSIQRASLINRSYPAVSIKLSL